MSVGKKISSHEGITQGDPTVMTAYSVGLTSLLDNLQCISIGIKHVVFTDDLTCGEKSY